MASSGTPCQTPPGTVSQLCAPLPRRNSTSRQRPPTSILQLEGWGGHFNPGRLEKPASRKLLSRRASIQKALRAPRTRRSRAAERLGRGSAGAGAQAGGLPDPPGPGNPGETRRRAASGEPGPALGSQDPRQQPEPPARGAARAPGGGRRDPAGRRAPGAGSERGAWGPPGAQAQEGRRPTRPPYLPPAGPPPRPPPRQLPPRLPPRAAGP